MFLADAEEGMLLEIDGLIVGPDTAQRDVMTDALAVELSVILGAEDLNHLVDGPHTERLDVLVPEEVIQDLLHALRPLVETDLRFDIRIMGDAALDGLLGESRLFLKFINFCLDETREVVEVIDLEDFFPLFLSVDDKAVFDEEAEVVVDGRPGDAQVFGQLTGRSRPVLEEGFIDAVCVFGEMEFLEECFKHSSSVAN